MRLFLGVSSLAIMAGCAQPMAIAPSQLGDARATLRIEAPDLAGYTSVPLVNHKVVNVTLSRFPGCADGAQRADTDSDLGKATLTPRENSQSVSIPAGVELAVFAESSEVTGGSSYSCRRAVRFRSELGGNYVLRFTPHRTFATRRTCGMEIRELREGAESPVASAHHAVVADKGFWRGRELDLCAR